MVADSDKLSLSIRSGAVSEQNVKKKKKKKHYHSEAPGPMPKAIQEQRWIKNMLLI